MKNCVRNDFGLQAISAPLDVHRLDNEAVKGLLAHENSHAVHADCEVKLGLMVMGQFLRFLLFSVTCSNVKMRTSSILLDFVVNEIRMKIFFLIAKALMLWTSRDGFEKSADSTAVQHGFRNGLIHGLERINLLSNSFVYTDFVFLIFNRTHMSMPERIVYIRNL